jgi:hypothetical protein
MRPSDRLAKLANEVSAALITLADELREVGLVEQAVRADTMSRQLSEAAHGLLTETQPIE